MTERRWSQARFPEAAENKAAEQLAARRHSSGLRTDGRETLGHDRGLIEVGDAMWHALDGSLRSVTTGPEPTLR